MATILLTWELGSGLGHILPLRAIGQALAHRGHRVIAALRDISQVGTLFTDTGITHIQAPSVARRSVPAFCKIEGFAHILANIGFADEKRLISQFAAWDNLFDSVRPDLVVTDHSPTALLALRGRAIRVVSLGPAFQSPPDTFPLPYWTPAGYMPAPLRMACDERSLTDNVNRLLRSKNRPKLERMGQLFNELDDVIIATYQELDPYGIRKATRYWGHWHPGSGIEPVWPAVSGPKAYAYLKPSPLADLLLATLHKVGTPCVIFSGEMTDSWQRRHGAPTIRFERRPLNMAAAARECDLAITNAGHGTVASMLIAGKPLLLLPRYVEQMINAQAVVRLGAGKLILQHDPKSMEPMLRSLLSTDRYRKGAESYAACYRNFVPGQQLPEIADRLESLAKSC